MNEAMDALLDWYVDKGVPDRSTALRICEGMGSQEYMDLAAGMIAEQTAHMSDEMNQYIRGEIVDRSVQAIQSIQETK